MTKVIELEWEHFKIPGLFRDYVSGRLKEEGVVDFSPSSLDDLRRIYETRMEYFRTRDIEWKTFLLPWGELTESYPIREEGIIITGQQPGLLGGPCFVLHKMWTASLLAHEAKLPRLLPVFWPHVEDHDILEALSIGGFCHGRVWFPECPDELKQSRLVLDVFPIDHPLLRDVLAKFLECLPITSYYGELIEKIQSTFNPDPESMQTTLPQHFRKIYEALGFTPPNLFLANTLDHRMKKGAVSLFQHLIFRWGELLELLQKWTEKLKRAGYRPPLRFHESYFPAFRILEGARHRLFWEDGRIVCPFTQESWDAESFLEWIEQEPHAFSPNVLLRPLLQDSVFPTVLFVGGPSEISYMIQIEPLYTSLKVPMPFLFPRLSITWVPHQAKKLLARSGLLIEDILVRDRILSPDEHLSHDVRTIQERLNVVKEKWEEIGEMLTQLEGQGSSSRYKSLMKQWKKMARQLSTFHNTLETIQVQGSDEWHALVHRIRTYVFPEKKFQERVYHPGILYAWGGLSIIQEIEQLPLFSFSHKIVEIPS